MTVTITQTIPGHYCLRCNHIYRYRDRGQSAKSKQKNMCSKCRHASQEEIMNCMVAGVTCSWCDHVWRPLESTLLSHKFRCPKCLAVHQITNEEYMAMRMVRHADGTSKAVPVESMT